MKRFIKLIVPDFILLPLSRYRHKVAEQRRRKTQRALNRQKTTEQVFTEIYAGNKWGGSSGEFHSGSGTSDEEIVSSYIAAISNLADQEGFKGLTFVEIGCGDFVVGRQLLPFCDKYIGADIVQDLVARNNREFSSPSTKFVHLNAVEDELPDGDVCFIRQVFQHLSNQQIAQILEKTRKYKWVFITEHYPSDNKKIRPNIDKVHGADIRLYSNSGVYLTEPPFSLPSSALTDVVEVRGAGVGEGYDEGVIRTYLYKPQTR